MTGGSQGPETTHEIRQSRYVFVLQLLSLVKHNIGMDCFYEESPADLMRNYNRRRFGYETFADSDDTETEEEVDEAACEKPDLTEEPPCPVRLGLVMRAETAGELMDSVKAHTAECATCGSIRGAGQADAGCLDEQWVA